MERRTFITSTGAGLLGSALGAGSILGAFDPSKLVAKPSAFNRLSANRSRPGGGQALSTESNDLTPYAGPWGDAELRHLLRRTMFGVPESQFLAAQALGSMNAVVDQLLACQDTTKVPLPAKLASWVDNMPKGDLQDPAKTNQTRLMAMERQQIENWWFDQIAQENLSIRQRMTLLWTNHFVTGSATVNIPGYMYYYLLLCMQYALGNFKDFASAIATSSAMLVYLNGDQNYVTGKNSFVNENFARELMELFTLGINFPGTDIPNYTQADIEQSARALTGWQHGNYKQTPVAPFTGILWDGTNGNPNWHDTTNKTFLGQTGNWGLSDVIDIIFQQPDDATATPPGIPAGFPAGYTSAYWASQKLYQEFVYYVPNPSVVDAMARLMLANNFEIAPVMQALLTSAHFYDVNVVGAQIKSPVHYIGSLIREFGITYPAFDPTDPPVKEVDKNGFNVYTDTNPTLSIVTAAILNVSQGQELLNPPNVKGWPGGENWLSAGTFQGRETYSNSILNNLFVNTKNNLALSFSADSYAAQIANDTTLSAEALSQSLEDLSLSFTLGPLESGDLDTDLQGTYKNPNYQYNTLGVKEFALYLTSLPEFQLF